MAVEATTHLNFRGQAREALTFYASVFDGDIAIITHAQAYGTTNQAEADLVGWGQVRSPEGFSIMAFDVPVSMSFDPGEIPFFVSLRGPDTDQILKYWQKLIEGAAIIQPLVKSGWAELYGMAKDKYGVTWVVDVPFQLE